FDAIFGNVATALAFEDALRGHLRDSSGNAREVHFCHWVDTEEAINRIYRSAFVSRGPSFSYIRGASERRRRVTLGLTVTTLALSAVGGDGSKPPTDGAYESLYWNTTGGSASEPGEGVTVRAFNRYPYVATFNSPARVTDANNEGWMQAIFHVNTDTDYRVNSIQVTHCRAVDPRATQGSLTVKASNAPWNGGGDTISVTMAHNA